MRADGLIERRHTAEGLAGRALWSPCGAWRYRLDRVWAPGGRRLVWVMLNPSRATEARTDPTVERCLRRARAAGYGRLTVVNLFALCATDPRALRRAADPVGPANDAAIEAAVRGAALVLCGWGTHGALQGRGARVAARLAASAVPLAHLGLTRGGHPRHPLYVGYATLPTAWTPGA
jgi:hypothetical protein